jgi:Na+/H+ antiporter
VILLVFLPPLLYSAAFFSSLREMRRNWRTISLLAIGLVLATMVTVAVAGHYALHLSWPVAFVLGAIVSPTDAVAPAAIVRRLGVPRRVVTIIEGENLTNDWTALVLYKFAVAAVTAGSFSLLEAGPKFVLTGVGGFAVGVAVGYVVAAIRKRLNDPPTEITISLLTAYMAYLPAEALGASGVIAAVTVGVYMGLRTPILTNHTTRIQSFAVWEILQFVLNAVLFLLIGLQLPTVLDGLSGTPAGEIIGKGALIAAVVVATRIVWVFVLTYLPKPVLRFVRRRDDPLPPYEQVAVVAWAGMRGAVSLAAALALPLTVDGGGPFPDRDLVIFLTFAVILVTLVGQGLTLPGVIERLGIEDDGLDDEEEHLARMITAGAALDRLDELAEEHWTYEDSIERMRGAFGYRQRRFEALKTENGDDGYEDRSGAYVRLSLDVIEAQRRALVEMRNRGEISDQVMRRVERDLDLEAARVDGAV